MPQVVIELSYVDCVLVPVEVGFLVEVIPYNPKQIISTRKPA
jgi:hypothetical protein